jgi:hypothetical protein
MAGMPIRAVFDGRFERSVKEITGRGRACLRVWSQVCIAVVIKRAEKKRVVEITRKMAQGTLEQAQGLLSASEARNRTQYRHYSPLQRHLARATRQFDAQVSACGQASGGAGKRHVAAGL